MVVSQEVVHYDEGWWRYVNGNVANYGGMMWKPDVPSIMDSAIFFVDLRRKGSIRNDEGPGNIDADRPRAGDCVVNGSAIRFDGHGMGSAIRNLNRPIRIRHCRCAVNRTLRPW